MLWFAVLFFVLVPLVTVYLIRMIDDEVDEELSQHSREERGPSGHQEGEDTPR